MKKFILIFVFVTGHAFADDMVNQQYVSAAQNNQPQLQAPFSNNPATDAPRQQPQQQNSGNNNPMNIYVPPSQQPSAPQNAAQNDSQQQYGQYQAQSQNDMQSQMNSPNQADMNNGQEQQPNAYPQQTPVNNDLMQANNQNADTGWQTRPASSDPASAQPMQPQQPSSQNYPYQGQASSQQQMPASQPGYSANQQPAAQTPYQGNPDSNPQMDVVPANPPAPSQTAGPYDDTAKQAWFTHCLKSITDQKMQPYAQPFCQCGWGKISGGGLDPGLLTSQNPADIQKANAIIQGISQECLMQVMGGQAQPQG